MPALAAVEMARRHLCGLAVLGQRVNGDLDDGWALEALRLAGDGTLHLCSFLYGAAKTTAMPGFLRLARDRRIRGRHGSV